MDDRFVSEKDAEEARKIKQEEWLRVRKPEDPKEPPVEDKSLYERLKDARDKKQAEHDEANKLQNLRSLDSEDCEFLSHVSEMKEREEKRKKEEEAAILTEFHRARSQTAEESKIDPSKLRLKPCKETDCGATGKRRTDKQAELIKAGVKRKMCDDTEKTEYVPRLAIYRAETSRPTAIEVIGMIPGVVDYASSSSNSDSDDSSDSGDLPVIPILIPKASEKSDKSSTNVSSEG